MPTLHPLLLQCQARRGNIVDVRLSPRPKAATHGMVCRSSSSSSNVTTKAEDLSLMSPQPTDGPHCADGGLIPAEPQPSLSMDVVVHTNVFGVSIVAPQVAI